MTSPNIFIVVVKLAVVFLISRAVNVRSSDDRDATNVFFTIWSGRNSTGHRHVKAIINIAEPENTKTKSANDVRLDVQQKTHFVAKRKFVQLTTEFVALEDVRIPPEGYELVRGLGWYRLHLKPLIWEEARLACEAEGAHLAVLNSPQEAAALKGISESAPSTISGATWSIHFFIGFSDKIEGKYFTIFGETLEDAGYAVWYPGKPDNYKHIATELDSDCGSVERSTFKLFDLPCKAKLAYFCEFEQ